MSRCLLCSSNVVETLLDLGAQPIANRFLRSPDSREELFSQVFGYCPECGLAQLVDPVATYQLSPTYDWITYNEPEGHLDHLVSILGELPGITCTSTIGGLSFKDDSTLLRLQRLGFGCTWRIDQAGELGISNPGAGVESIQDRLRPGLARDIASAHGKADILIARHILEHAPDPMEFAQALKQLAAPGGYIVIEVPDCSRAFANLDYTTLWEEHPIYFTPGSLRRFCALCGFSLVKFLCFPYSFENSLVAIVREGEGTREVLSGNDDELMKGFSDAFPRVHERTHGFIEDFVRHNGAVAFFGAGHLTCAFINVFGVGQHSCFVVDDNPHKQGLYMPGSHLPIVGSERLLHQDIRLCLLGLSPEIEDRVIAKQGAFLGNGGKFASIFPGSGHRLAIWEGM